MTDSAVRKLCTATDKLAAACDALSFSAPVSHVYNPLIYAREAHHAYLRLCGGGKKRVMFLGMNPGPWGMAQTGVPFGEVSAVRDWMKIRATIGQPSDMHPARPVRGLDCPRAEASGRRLWGLFAERYPQAEDFFAAHAVLNYCPLLFLAAEGKRVPNFTPDKLSSAEQTPLFAKCDDFLRAAVAVYRPDIAVGVGAFARHRLELLFGGTKMRIGGMLHPSPANPAANRGFAVAAAAQLQQLGVWD